MNKLPDEILDSIISLLSVNEAIRMAVVCRRWKKLWMKSFTFSTALVCDGGVKFRNMTEGLQKLKLDVYWWRLRDCQLSKVNLDDEDVKCMLFNSPNLERLCVRDSHPIENLGVANALKLKYLEVHECRSLRMQVIWKVSRGFTATSCFAWLGYHMRQTSRLLDFVGSWG